jgi:hypothetical protein
MKMKKTITKFLLLQLVLTSTFYGFSQQKEKEYAEDVFTGTQLINSQTTGIMAPKSWSFELQHRFGKIGLDSSITQQMLGLDLPAVIRFAFGKSINDKMYIEIGRSNYLKTIDIEAKYLIRKQTTDKSMPVSIAAYINTAIQTDKFPTIPPKAYFEDDTTQFKYKPSHRLSYNTQLIISSKVSEKLSIQLNPILIYKNLAPPYNDNFTMILAGGLRYKTGLSSAIIAEYAHVFNNRGDEFHNPLSIGMEFGTVGHTFQIFVGNASKIIENHIYTTSSINMNNGEFLIGFNMQRTFWKKSN